MKKLVLPLLVSAAFLAFTGCSGATSSSGGTVFNPPPVQAATYSNASITGTYAVNFTAANTSSIFTSIGTFVADGNGTITSGALSEYAGGTPCTVSFTGTYTLKADASGTATLTTKPSGTAGCPVAATGSLQLAIQAAQQGQALLITESDQGSVATGTALKQ